jgi:serine/threonine protein phosphatase PrpC
LFELLKGLFKSKSGNAGMEVQTAPLTEEQLKDAIRKPVQLKTGKFIYGEGQSTGRQRDHNEDSLFAFSANLTDGSIDLPFGLFIVADGMGGHQNGEVASGVAVRVFSHHILTRVYLPYLNVVPETPSDSLIEILEGAMNQAQQAVFNKAPGGGTTLTVALVIGEQITLAHVGDSRGYFIYPDGRIQVVTQDHSLVHRLVELGQLNEKEALIHPQRNVLYRAVGQAEPYKPDIHSHPIPRPGYLMLCSDGLWGVVPETDIFRVITNSTNPIIACHELVELANANGGPDNISVILVRFF